MYTFLGKMCRKCPIVRTACQTMVPPRPVAVVNPLKIVPVGERIVCPLQACPSVYIPAECREMVTFQFRGQTCQGCPQFKEGCLPMGNIQQPAKPTDIPQIPNIPQIPAVDPVACPELGCPFINIPQDCLEQPTYNYKGIVCNHCPLWREGCVPGSALNNEEKVAPPCPVFRCRPVDQAIPKECIEVPTVFIRGRNCTTCPRYRPGCAASGLPVDTNRPGPTTSETPVVPTGPDKEISCPLVPCTKILIPQECREQTPFQFMGKTCLGCPVWREGCVPGSDRELNTNTITETPTTTTQSMPADKIACPLMQCNRMFIPLECREVTSFLYLNVKQCYRCPKWRVGCIPGDKNRDLLNTNAVNRNTDNINTNTGRINFGNDAISGSNAPNTGSNSISDMRGVLPVNQLLNMVNEINCPPLPCPAVFIPRHCQVAHSYVYEGISCAGCPSWRPGCSAFDGSWQNSHFDGLLAYNLFRELAGFNA